MIYPVRAFYKRDLRSIEGVLTIQEYNPQGQVVRKLVDRVPARSGQRLHTHTDWTRARSPIPMGDWWIWLDPTPLQMSPGGNFWPVSSDKQQKHFIHEPGPAPVGVKRRHRELIGIHSENDKPGSIGCIVVVDKWPQVDSALKELAKKYDHLPLRVLE